MSSCRFKLRDDRDDRYELISFQLLKPVREGRAAMRADLADRYITNVPQNVKHLLLIASVLDPREGIKDLSFLNDGPFPASWRTDGKYAFEMNYDIHYSRSSKSSGPGTVQESMISQSSAGESESPAQGGSPVDRVLPPRLKDGGVSFSSFFKSAKKSRCVLTCFFPVKFLN